MRARKELLIVLWHILISPFGIVRFKHFFLADILTSFVIPFKYTAYITCFFISENWLDSNYPDKNRCPYITDYKLIIAFFPFWFRFA